MPRTRFILEVYQSRRNRLWYWRVRSRKNRKIVADGAEGYVSAYNVRRALIGAPLNWRDIEWS